MITLNIRDEVAKDCGKQYWEGKKKRKKEKEREKTELQKSKACFESSLKSVLHIDSQPPHTSSFECLSSLPKGRSTNIVSSPIPTSLSFQELWLFSLCIGRNTAIQTQVSQIQSSTCFDLKSVFHVPRLNLVIQELIVKKKEKKKEFVSKG